MFKRIRNERGFTLVELLVVLAILAILIAVVVPNLTGLLDGASTTAMKTEKDVVLNAIDAYFTQDYKVASPSRPFIPGNGGNDWVILAKDDGTTLTVFTKYLRRDTKYYYSWNKHGEDLSVCPTSEYDAGDCY